MKDEDKTFENERQFMKEVDDRAEDRGPLDLTLLTEQYKADLKKYQDRESMWVKTQNQLEGTKQIVMNMSGTVRALHTENKVLKKEIDRLNEEIQLLELKNPITIT
jgi:predicted RNase H-like nuclease (RuvC/YqgF family)|tara:strand:- start:162 stop:479 length:318 start_codon:yes stop_codon:yes gene_type:complete